MLRIVEQHLSVYSFSFPAPSTRSSLWPCLSRQAASKQPIGRKTRRTLNLDHIFSTFSPPLLCFMINLAVGQGRPASESVVTVALILVSSPVVDQFADMIMLRKNKKLASLQKFVQIHVQVLLWMSLMITWKKKLYSTSPKIHADIHSDDLGRVLKIKSQRSLSDSDKFFITFSKKY